MRRWPVLIALTLSCVAHAQPAGVHDLTRVFSDFAARTDGQPLAERVAGFRREVAPAFPAFYERSEAEQDKLVERALQEFLSIRDVYLAKSRSLETELARHRATLRAAFPGFAPTAEVYLLHSLGEMDAGPRTLAGHDYLIFGVDMMAKLHGNADESAFYQHELFHLYHQDMLGDCGERRVWLSLWKEGLATYVSHQLNPSANEAELLLDFPAGMPERTRAVLPAALAQLEQVLDSGEESHWGGLFRTRYDDGTGLPGRRGYYLGYLVAKEAGARSTLQTLARLDCAGVRATVQAALRGLKQRAGFDGTAPQ